MSRLEVLMNEKAINCPNCVFHVACCMLGTLCESASTNRDRNIDLSATTKELDGDKLGIDPACRRAYAKARAIEH